MDIDVENAEVLLQGFDDRVDFSKKVSSLESSEPVAADLVFIMKNAAIDECGLVDHNGNSMENEHHNKKDSSSDVEILEITQGKAVTICISSSEDENIQENDKSQTISQDSVNSQQLCANKPMEQNVEKICSKMLKRLVWKVDALLRNVSHSDEDFDSSDDSDCEQDRINLRSIIEDEERVTNNIPKVANEVLPEELEIDEGIVDLKEDDNLLTMGVISGIVEKMIVIEANKDTPALDADTALFAGDKLFLGKIFDTFGPVKTPFYSVRLSEGMDTSKLSKGNNVYFVPFNQELTKYVFVEQLKKLKGSDASWMNDCEPPPQHLDYSDDEEERKAKSELNKKRQLERETKKPEDITVNSGRKGSSKNQKRIQKKRIIDLTQGHNPILEHAKRMNNPSSKNRQDENQRDIPLSEFLQNDNTVCSDKQDVQRDASLEYISPLHQSNPNQNRSRQHFNTKRQNKQFQQSFNNDDIQSNHDMHGNTSQSCNIQQYNWRNDNQNQYQSSNNSFRPPFPKPHHLQSLNQQPFDSTNQYPQHSHPNCSPGPMPYPPNNNTQNRFPFQSSAPNNSHHPPYQQQHHQYQNHSSSPNQPPYASHNLPLHEACNQPPLYGPPHGPVNQLQHGPHSQLPHGLANQPMHGPTGPPNHPLYGPPDHPPHETFHNTPHGLPNQPQHRPPNMSPNPPPPHGPSSHPPHAPPNQPPYGGPPNQPPQHVQCNQFTRGPSPAHNQPTNRSYNPQRLPHPSPTYPLPNPSSQAVENHAPSRKTQINTSCNQPRPTMKGNPNYSSFLEMSYNGQDSSNSENRSQYDVNKYQQHQNPPYRRNEFLPSRPPNIHMDQGPHHTYYNQVDQQQYNSHNARHPSADFSVHNRRP